MTGLESFLDSFDAEPGYLDWAAFGPLSPSVRAEAHADAELLSAGRPSGIDLVFSRADEARALLADLLGTTAERVTLQPSTTHGLQQAMYGLSGAVLMSSREFPSLTVTAQRASALGGAQPQWLDIPDGFVTPEAIRDGLTDDTTAVAVSVVDYRTGYLADLTALRDVIGDRLLIVDAMQGFGVVDADWGAADVVVANGYKWLRAGRGTGFAAFSDRALERITPVLSGFAAAGGVLGTFPVSSPVEGAQAFSVTFPDHLATARLATAVRDVRDVGVAQIAEVVRQRADDIATVAEQFGLPIVTPRNRQRHAGIVSLAPSPDDTAPLAAALANHGIAASLRSGLVRIGAHAGTGAESVRLLTDALAEFAGSRRHG
ncbi:MULTISPECIES: aminotransferase class V-fold PLP-dependent enzyme [unclassified Microbacterium]|uniref:aminotransferase class V-fold PLP-dependent enzyme n=1 Tax=unclassified Microbacterium TaxID=2609290 RepID=UPI00214BF923|nr:MULTISPECIES: aminotransferase class V-fold PLP-dependent enzyme [unclassified Microbacterium]MCR2784362.1 aminotransferase class V-fold PLP-dependent enzyme [Microbacterium sp. zg.B96]MDL5350730.1 aminotransferase class V-fold PLP-dependent enzyme [Microbacterium sp. zg-YB36]WIM14817.1 aminotransferase class V-fold PLP-dependent enzyme [Microbacterium sp. zg-B96]